MSLYKENKELDKDVLTELNTTDTIYIIKDLEGFIRNEEETDKPDKNLSFVKQKEKHTYEI